MIQRHGYRSLLSRFIQVQSRRTTVVGMHDFNSRRNVLTAFKSSTARRSASTASPTTTSSSPSSYIDGPDTHFGFENVKIEEKEGRVRQVFENVADSYDIMNDLMSGGLHRYWKDTLLEKSAVGPMASAIREIEQQQQHQKQQQQDKSVKVPNLRILDVAGGTGDIAFRFFDAAGCLDRSKSRTIDITNPDPVSVTVCDINAEMLRVGRSRAVERYGEDLVKNGIGGSMNKDNITADDGAIDQDQCPLSFVQGNAQDLCDFEDNSFDLYTIAFGLRNVTDVDLGLREAYRVLKPGGRFMCLEFSQVPDPILRQIYDTYSFNVIPGMGELVANDRASYQYLVESIRKFSNQEELVGRMEAAGFQLCKYANLTGGIVAIHEGWKPI